MKKGIQLRLPLLTIVIPCFNEAENIPIILNRFKVVEDKFELKNIFKILIVNNGSTDNTNKVLNNEIKKFSFAKALNIRNNKGYGYGIIQGLRKTSTEFIGWTHGDLQTDPEDIVKGIELIKKSNFSEKLFIKGCREGRPIFDQFFSDCMSIFESLLFLYPLYEINAQPTIFHRSLFDKCFNPPNDFSLDLYFYIFALKSNLIVKRIKVKFLNRLHGYSKWNKNFKSKLRFIIRTFLYSIKLRIKL